ncbi:MAG: four helix bundle protein [Dehalogenimonas sp.]|jgi:four helix bundle protein|uniref:Four helix bundle protein n=1 Tax=Candidatus Dehalogenimonas loeffleri TaxID=3127115 RepID=A0ABZ2J1E2_9CHLR|nr:four helix bundle protein [Dehalogenimonas sp.]
MSNATNTTNNSITDKPTYDIHERIYQFILRTIKLVDTLPKTTSNAIISNQLLRCVTSIGANDQEADGSLTKKDFIHCYSIVRKEAKETTFWLRLIGDTNDNLAHKMGPIIQEGHEITAIISTIINHTRISPPK